MYREFVERNIARLQKQNAEYRDEIAGLRVSLDQAIALGQAIQPSNNEDPAPPMENPPPVVNQIEEFVDVEAIEPELAAPPALEYIDDDAWFDQEILNAFHFILDENEGIPFENDNGNNEQQMEVDLIIKRT